MCCLVLSPNGQLRVGGLFVRENSLGVCMNLGLRFFLGVLIVFLRCLGAKSCFFFVAVLFVVFCGGLFCRSCVFGGVFCLSCARVGHVDMCCWGCMFCM